MTTTYSREIRAHVERLLGPVEHVVRTRRARGPQALPASLELLVVAPTDERPCLSVVTSGMSAQPMRTPREAREWRRAELMINLPEDWPLDDEEQGGWPLRWLEQLARFPHENRTWLGLGHSLPNGEPPQPLAPGTAQCVLLLVPPYIAGPEFARLELGGRERIHFWSVMPIYAEEFELASSAGPQALAERFEQAELVDLVDLERVNVALP